MRGRILDIVGVVVCKMQHHREQSVTRISLIAGFCRQLCEEASCSSKGKTATGVAITFDPLTNRFSTDSDQGSCNNFTSVGESESEDLDESLEIDLEDNSLSFGFSDSDSDDVIEELDDEEEEEEAAETGKGSREQAEVGVIVSREVENENSKIEQLKVRKINRFKTTCSTHYLFLSCRLKEMI